MNTGIVNKSGQTPLSLACVNGHTEIVKYLLDVHHCDPKSIAIISCNMPFLCLELSFQCSYYHNNIVHASIRTFRLSHFSYLCILNNIR